jgi:DNA primase large subunit
MAHALDLPFNWSPFEAVAQVDAGAVVAELEARATRDNARADQLQAELDQLRRQHESRQQEAQERANARELANAWAENRRGPTTVIDLTDQPEDHPEPGFIDLSKPEVRSEVAEARELAERWAKSIG